MLRGHIWQLCLQSQAYHNDINYENMALLTEDHVFQLLEDATTVFRGLSNEPVGRYSPYI